MKQPEGRKHGGRDDHDALGEGSHERDAYIEPEIPKKARFQSQNTRINQYYRVFGDGDGS